MSVDPMTIVFALVAIFVCWRLWSVLGTRTGAGRPPIVSPRAARMGDVVDVTPAPRAQPAASADRWKGVAEAGGGVAAGLDAVAAGDPEFDPLHFLAGARAAYEMIINAFAAGDVEALRGLLAPEPLANFSRAIAERNAAGQKMAVTLVSLDKADIVEAAVRDATALISVKFASKMTSATTDRSGTVIDGSATRVVDHFDVWTFARPFAARNPNWLLSATEATH